MDWKNKAVVITGGGSGLGEGTARNLVEAGASVVLADVNVERGTALADELGDAARFAQTDVTDEAACISAVDMAVSEFGGLHGVVNCAGIGSASRLIGREGPHPLSLFELVMKVNVVGTFNMMRFGADAILKNEPNEDGTRGVIVNTASVAAYDGQIGQVAYAASKGAVVSMTLPVARELAKFGVRVMTIAPGLFDTPMFDGLGEDARKSLESQVPHPSRLGKPSEYAQLVRQIFENPMLNGETIRLDGAIRMQAR